MTILYRLIRFFAQRATNTALIAADVLVLCHCGKAVSILNAGEALHGVCACGQCYSGALFVRFSDEPLPWRVTL